MIRLATEQDIDEIATMHNDLAMMHESYALILAQASDSKNKYLDYLKKQFNSPNSFIFVYSSYDKIIGYAHILIANLDSGMILNNRCFINDLYVSSEYRNQGIGKKFLDYILYVAKEKQCQYVNLNVVVNNIAAMRFWQKNGFIPFSTQHYFLL